MICSTKLLSKLKKNKIDFYSGVPDSVLKNFTSLLKINSNHISVNNEGSAISLGIGYHLATGKIPCIYLQNSGLGNAINPLISIAHKKVYAIPMVLLIGWRGSKNSDDEPQHLVKGKITPNLLKLLNIKFCVLNTNNDLKKVDELIKLSKTKKQVVACLIKNKILTKSKNTNFIKNSNKVKRFSFLRCLLNNIKTKSIFVSTTGYTSRELFHLTKNKQNFKKNSFFMVGGMGHSSMVALGASLKTKKQVICIDGDGSLLMHTGAIAISARFGKRNSKYILLNNFSHESVGGQPTNSELIDYKLFSQSFGYKNYFVIKNEKNMTKILKMFLKSIGPSFLEVRIKNESIKDLPRPKNLIKIKNQLMLMMKN